MPSRLHLSLAAVAIAATAVCSSTAVAGTARSAATGSTPVESLRSEGPLTRIDVGNDLACQIFRGRAGQVYPQGTVPADCTTTVRVNGLTYTSHFGQHGGSAASNLSGAGNARLLDPVSQGEVTGAGTVRSPFSVTTVADAGPIRVTQVDSYVTGDDFFTTSMTLRNTSDGPEGVRLYRGWDCYLGGSDQGYGFKDLVVEGSTGCSQTPNNSPSALVEGLVPNPAQGPSRFLETGYSSVWSAIASGNPLANTCRCNERIDNGAVVSWDLDIAPGQSVTRTVREVFSPEGDIPNPDSLPDPVVQFQISPGYHDFGGVAAGSRSTPEVFTVENVGDAPITISPGGIRLAGDNPSQFAVTGGTCAPGSTIAGGGSCTVAVTFAPTGFAAADATIGVTTNEGTRSAIVAGRAPNAFDAVYALEVAGIDLVSITPARRVAARGARRAAATVVSTGAGPGTVTLRRCLTASCKRSVVVARTAVDFAAGSQVVALRTRALRPGAYLWTASLGLSTVKTRMLVPGAKVRRAVPVTG